MPLLVCQIRTCILRDDIQFDKNVGFIFTFGAGIFLPKEELGISSECLCPHNQMLEFVLKLGINIKVTSTKYCAELLTSIILILTEM